MIPIIGIVGIFARSLRLRILLWILSIPYAFIGIMALLLGGIAEPFNPDQMKLFCVIVFWPAIGCTIGQIIIVLYSMKKKKR